MKKLLLLGALCAFSSPPAEAVTVLINDNPYDVKALVHIDVLSDPAPGKRYHYTLNDRPEELVLSQPIENKDIPDARPLREKSPIVYWRRRIWKNFKRLAEVVSVGAMIKNSFKG